MARLPSIRPASGVVAHVVIVLALSTSSGCERVSYWSGPTEPAEDEQVDTPRGATSSPSSGAGVTADEAAILRSAAVCATELYGQLATATSALSVATTTAATSGEDDDRDAARAAWLATMDVWEQAEAIRVGPVGPAALPGGSGARDEIYAWPMTSRCLVEQTIVSRAYEDVDFGEFSLPNVRGLGAAEYLLFYEGADNACAPTTSINETGAWTALSDDDLRTRKSSYAAAVAAALDLRVRQVDATWRDDGGGYAETFATSGADGGGAGRFATSHAALQALFAGMVVVTRQLRDDKLGAPLDDANCDDACETLEAPFAHVSAKLARGTLSGVARLFRGCATGGGVGLDDLLTTSGQGDAAVRVGAAFDAAAAALDAIGGDDLASSLVSERERVEGARASVATLATALEVDVAVALQLEAPAE